MATVIVLFNLKEGQSAHDYEQWARAVDVPTVNGLDSVNSFRVYRTKGMLGTDAPAPYQYIEVLQVTDLAGLGRDISSEEMQQIASSFQGMADNPTFIICEQFA